MKGLKYSTKYASNVICEMVGFKGIGKKPESKGHGLSIWGLKLY
jgi:hypothetical protein